MRFIDREEVAARLGYARAIPLVRDAMIAFSAGATRQLLRAILPLGDGRLFGVMPGAIPETFGAKLISVFPGNAARDVQSHQGLVVLFDPETGAPVCALHAGEITAIRTAAASAVATDALARPNATRLAIFGTGEQAVTHARAIAQVRPLASITVWGRNHGRAAALALRLCGELGIDVTAIADGAAAAAGADIICTVSSADEPVLRGAWVDPGTHLNVVGSSHAGPAEIDSDLVATSRFIADSREGVLAQGAEFLRAKAAGWIDDSHIAGEIGAVLTGTIEGRQSPEQITLYKSLGHIVQDLACSWALYSDAT